MKTVGIIGGMSWESTLEYYKILNKLISEKLGGLHSAKILLESYDFEKIANLQKQEAWQELSKILINSALALQSIGADYIAIATNTMHICASDVQKAITVPLIHIGDAAAKMIVKNNIDTVLLLGTKYTMSKEFYKGKFENEYGITVILPEEAEKSAVNDIIYNELCKGIVKEDSKLKFKSIIENAADKGAKAVVLGCTELPCIIDSAPIPIIDTLKIHCEEIADRMLEGIQAK